MCEKKVYICKENFNFKFDASACEYCGGRCCYGESGYIWLDEKEIELIAQFLEIEEGVFVSDYLRHENGKYTIKDIKYNGYYSCLFFDREARKCSIYSVRPMQCRTYPFWNIYENDSEQLFYECPGVEALDD